MTVYTTPIAGKLGVRSGVSHKMVFGICCDSKKECMDSLRSRIGYYQSLKWRWIISQWNSKDLKDQQEYYKGIEESQKFRKECTKEYINYINENKYKLKDKFLEKFNKLYMNVKSKKNCLEKWLSMPDRRKEIKNDN